MIMESKKKKRVIRIATIITIYYIVVILVTIFIETEFIRLMTMIFDVAVLLLVCSYLMEKKDDK